MNGSGGLDHTQSRLGGGGFAISFFVYLICPYTGLTGSCSGVVVAAGSAESTYLELASGRFTATSPGLASLPEHHILAATVQCVVSK